MVCEQRYFGGTFCFGNHNKFVFYSFSASTLLFGAEGHLICKKNLSPAIPKNLSL